MLRSRGIVAERPIRALRNFKVAALFCFLVTLFSMNNVLFGQGYWENNTSNPQAWTPGSVQIGATSASAPTDFWGGNSKLVLPSLSYLGNQGSYGVTFSWNTYRRNDNTWPVVSPINGKYVSSYILQGLNGMFFHVGEGNTNSAPPSRLVINPNGNVDVNGGLRVGTGTLPSDFWGGNSKLNVPNLGFLGNQGSYGVTFSWNTYRRYDNTWPVLSEINSKYVSSFILQGLNGISIHVGEGNTGDAPPSRIVIMPNGNVGIGTSTPQSSLAVNGKITCKEVEVTLSGFPDFVFEEDYELMPLEEVEQHIKQYKHLPEIPSEREVLENGVNIGEMQAKLLQKVEELTLYMIQQNSLVQSLKKENDDLKARIGSLPSE